MCRWNVGKSLQCFASDASLKKRTKQTFKQFRLVPLFFLLFFSYNTDEPGFLFFFLPFSLSLFFPWLSFFFFINTHHAVSGISFSCTCKTLQSCWTAVQFWVFFQCNIGWWGVPNPGTHSTERLKLLDLWCYTSWVPRRRNQKRQIKAATSNEWTVFCTTSSHSTWEKSAEISMNIPGF